MCTIILVKKNKNLYTGDEGARCQTSVRLEIILSKHCTLKQLYCHRNFRYLTQFRWYFDNDTMSYNC